MLLIIQIIGGVLAAILAAAGIIAIMWAVGKVKGVELSLTLLNNANEGLRKVVIDAGLEKARDREHFLGQLKSQELECATRVAKLEGQVATLSGQVDSLTTGLADRIIQAVKVNDDASHFEARLARVEERIDNK